MFLFNFYSDKTQINCQDELVDRPALKFNGSYHANEPQLTVLYLNIKFGIKRQTQKNKYILASETDE